MYFRNNINFNRLHTQRHTQSQLDESNLSDSSKFTSCSLSSGRSLMPHANSHLISRVHRQPPIFKSDV